MSMLTLWWRSSGGPVRRAEVAVSGQLDCGGRLAVDGGPVGRGPTVVLMPLRARSGCAVLLTPDAIAGQLTVNGIRVVAGAQLLQHTDRLQLADTELWVAAERRGHSVDYDPAVHGDEVFCFRTKARLQPGQAVVACPGTERRSCGLHYSAAAWETGLPCHQCGHDPRAPQWQPPASVEQDTTRRALLGGQVTREVGRVAV